MEKIQILSCSSYAVIDLRKLEENVRKVKAYLPPDVQFLPVLKGDACGHGIEKVSERLTQKCGINMLCVGHVIEAEQIRAVGIQSDILVLGGVPFHNIPSVIENRLTTTIATREYAEQLSDYAVKAGEQVNVHVKIDTGLGRMGIPPGKELNEFLGFLEGLPNIVIEGAYTHFASSEAINTTFTETQAKRFEHALLQFESLGIKLKYCHLSNTPALLRFPQYNYNMVRSMLLPLGIDWSIDQNNRLNLDPILCWKGFITQIREVASGEAIGYGQSIRAKQKMRIAIASFGYADGYPEDLAANGSYVILHGKKAPVLAVTMDMTFIDITGIDFVSINDRVLIWGRDGDDVVDAEAILRQTSHTQPYLLSNISHRVRRIYIE